MTHLGRMGVLPAAGPAPLAGGTGSLAAPAFGPDGMEAVVRRAGLLAVLLLLAGLLLGAWPRGLAAQELEAGLPLLASTRFEEIERGIAAVAASGSPRALPVLEALIAGRLLADQGQRALFIDQPDGSLATAASGSVASVDRAALKPVRLNNRVRRAAETALGGLTLLSPDRAQRLAAAQTVFRSRDASALPTLRRALTAEGDPGVLRAMQQAEAAIQLLASDTTPERRATAVAVLAGRGDQDALALLNSIPADEAAPIAAAIDRARAQIEQQLALVAVGQNLLYGISLGSVLLLAAIGLAVTFGVMGVINMAHGEMVMIGAYVTFMVQEACRLYAPGLLDTALIAAVPLAFLVAGAVGVGIERGIIRFLYGRPLETLLATFGVSLVLQQAVRSVFGPTNREVSTPSWMSGSIELVAGLSVTANRLAIVVFCLAVFASLLVMIRTSRFGLEMRAVTQNRRMAAAMGIRTSRVDAMTFGLGSGVAGMAGVALSQIDNVSPNLGQSYIIDSFLVVVFGGVGSLWGTLTGAFTLGIANKLLEPAAGAVLGKILLLIAIILFIQKRPRGLFALKGRAIEA